MKLFNQTIRSFGFTVLAMGAFLGAPQAATSQPTHEFTISASPLNQALQEFAKQAGIQIFYKNEMVDTFHAKSLEGAYDLTEALDILLQGTGLVYEKTEEKTYVLKRSKTTGSVQRARASVLVGGESVSKQMLIEEIVVTANKREARLVDVPSSIGVMSSGEIEGRGYHAMNQLALAVPSLNIRETAPGSGQVTIRGIGTSQTIGGAATSAIYIDEMPLVLASSDGGSAAPDVRMFDVERVEVLRGPQGTIYGEGAMGGMLRIVTKKPNPEAFEGAVKAEYFGFAHGDDGFSTDLMLNMPLIQDKLAVRAVAYYRDQGGYIDNIQLGMNDVNEFDVLSGRIALRYTGDRLTVDGSFMHQDNHSGLVVQQADEDYQVIANLETPRDGRYDLYNLTASYDFDDVQLVASSSYSDREYDFISDVSSPGVLGALNFFFGHLAPEGFQVAYLYTNEPYTMESFAQEIRLVSNSDGVLQWTLGGFYKNTDLTQDRWAATLPAIPINLLKDNRDVDIEQLAVFGEATYDVSEKLHATIGVRWFNEEQNNAVLNDGLFASPVVDTEVPLSYEVIQPRFSLAYDLSGETTVYATVSKGFRSGGVNPSAAIIRNVPIAQGGDPAAPDTYGEETLWNYEAGVKGAWFDSRLSGSLSLFYMKWEDMQLVGNPENPVFRYTDNVGAAHSMGIELDATLKPIDQLTLIIGLQLLEAEVDKGTASIEKGETLNGAPTYKFSLGGEYVVPLSESLNGRLRADYTISDGTYATLPNDSYPKSPSYDLLNLRAGVEFGQWNVELFAENALDSFLPIEAGVTTKPNFQGYYILPPRRVGLSIRTSF